MADLMVGQEGKNNNTLNKDAEEELSKRAKALKKKLLKTKGINDKLMAAFIALTTCDDAESLFELSLQASSRINSVERGSIFEIRKVKSFLGR